MEWAATSQAAGGHAALTARHATDPATMARVLARLRGRVIPAAPPLIGPAEALEYRTCTLLGPLYAKGHR
jgi:hypothetical protein